MRHRSRVNQQVTEGLAKPLPLSESIELFMSSENTDDLEALADCFAAHATVRDGGDGLEGNQNLEARNHKEIPAHRGAGRHHRARRQSTVRTTLTGDFPGSPITLDFVFTLEDSKIAALEMQS